LVIRKKPSFQQALRPILGKAFCQKGQTLDGFRQPGVIELDGKIRFSSEASFRPHLVFGDM